MTLTEQLTAAMRNVCRTHKRLADDIKAMSQALLEVGESSNANIEAVARLFELMGRIESVDE